MIRASKLSKFYGGKRALGPVDFEIADGECVGFLGLNGAGKTTALRILACDLRPTSGTIEVGGFDVVSDPHAVRKKVGFLPENPPLYSDMIVADYIKFAGELRGMTKDEVKKRLPEVVEITDLGDVAGDQLFTVGLLSVADALLEVPLETIVEELPLADEVGAALLRRDGPAGTILDAVVSYEQGEFDAASLHSHSRGIATSYRDALGWAVGTVSALS